MKTRLKIYCGVILCCGLAAGCSTTKNLPEEEVLYTGIKEIDYGQKSKKKAKKKAQHHAAPLSGISAIDYTTEYSDWLMPTPPTNAIPIVAEEPEEPEIENHKEPEKSHANPNIPEQMELFS